MINYHGMKKTVAVFLFFLIYSIFSEGFVENTLIKTINQKIPINQLKEGDLVLTYNFKTSEFEYKKILKIFKKTVDKIIQLKIKDVVVEVCFNQRFYNGNNWIRAQNLQPGNYILKNEKQLIQVDDIVFLEKEVDLYILSIKDNHNFFISDQDILTHNSFGQLLKTASLSFLERSSVGGSFNEHSFETDTFIDKQKDKFFTKNASFYETNRLLNLSSSSRSILDEKPNINCVTPIERLNKPFIFTTPASDDILKKMPINTGYPISDDILRKIPINTGYSYEPPKLPPFIATPINDIFRKPSALINVPVPLRPDDLMNTKKKVERKSHNAERDKKYKKKRVVNNGDWVIEKASNNPSFQSKKNANLKIPKKEREDEHRITWKACNVNEAHGAPHCDIVGPTGKVGNIEHNCIDRYTKKPFDPNDYL